MQHVLSRRMHLNAIILKPKFPFDVLFYTLLQGNSRCCAPCSLECQTAARNDECPASCRQYEGNPTCCGGCPQKCIDAAKYYLIHLLRVISHDISLFTETREMSHHADNIGEILNVIMNFSDIQVREQLVVEFNAVKI